MKISNVYSQEEIINEYTYRFEFQGVTNNKYPSFMLHCDNHRVINSMLSRLNTFDSLRKVKAYETNKYIRV